MRLGHYASLLGLAARETGPPATTSTVNIQPVAPSIDQYKEINHHHNHRDHHHHHQTTVLHPTMQAYLHQAEIKERSIEQMQKVLKAEQEEQTRKEKRDGLDYRPLIITNYLTDETVYPAYSSLQQSGGFKLAPGETHIEKLPLGEINMLRVWIRRGCTEGLNDDELHCLTGNCGDKLRCNAWGEYGVSVLENAIFPSNEPPSMWPDFSNVEGSTMLPMIFTIDDCLQLSCDPTGIDCPTNMQVKDAAGKLLQCSCGASDWNLLLQTCPNEGGAEIQKQIKAKCPDIYSFAQDDASSQKHCPYKEKSAMRIEIGIPDKNDKGNVAQIPEQPQQIIIPNMENQKEAQVTNAPDKLVWGPGVKGFDEWSKTYVYNA